jgi:hypothetical protein
LLRCFNIYGITVHVDIYIKINYKRNIIIRATAVFDKENLEANIPTIICCGDAVKVLYNNKLFVIP